MDSHHRPHRPPTAATGVRPRSGKNATHHHIPRRQDQFPFAVIAVVIGIGLFLTAYAFMVKDTEHAGQRRNQQAAPPPAPARMDTPGPTRMAEKVVESTQQVAAKRAAEIASVPTPAKPADAKQVDGVPNRTGAAMPSWLQPETNPRPTSAAPAQPAPTAPPAEKPSEKPAEKKE